VALHEAGDVEAFQENRIGEPPMDVLKEISLRCSIAMTGTVLPSPSAALTA
jgi:hypothetical protein